MNGYAENAGKGAFEMMTASAETADCADDVWPLLAGWAADADNVFSGAAAEVYGRDPEDPFAWEVEYFVPEPEEEAA